jgi:ABC-2 type transport system ATP-binding protein
MIEIQELSKKYGSFLALDQLSFEVAPGEVFGLLGANGSGKSTLNKILMGLLRPTSGTVKIASKALENDRSYLDSLGYLPEFLYLYPEMTGFEFLHFIANLKKMKNASPSILKFLEYFGLIESKDIFLSAYSQGMKKKIGLSAALLGSPQVLLLDEPTNGLDPVSIYLFREIIKELKKQGKTVLLSSHILEFIEKSCDRIGILESGKLLNLGTLSELQNQAQKPATASLEELFMHFTGKTIAPAQELFSGLL